jgi:hypothetical protein
MIHHWIRIFLGSDVDLEALNHAAQQALTEQSFHASLLITYAAAGGSNFIPNTVRFTATPDMKAFKRMLQNYYDKFFL